MTAPIINSSFRLLRVLFIACETLFLGSLVLLELLWRLYPHQRADESLAAVFAVSWVALVFVCFYLRRAARPLAITGWLSAFAVFVYGLLSPQL